MGIKMVVTLVIVFFLAAPEIYWFYTQNRVKLFSSYMLATSWAITIAVTLKRNNNNQASWWPLWQELVTQVDPNLAVHSRFTLYNTNNRSAVKNISRSIILGTFLHRYDFLPEKKIGKLIPLFRLVS